jgi:hypothetical protein
MGAVKAKGVGCERSLLAWWGWHGGRERPAGASSQEAERILTHVPNQRRDKQTKMGFVVMHRGRQDNLQR